MGKGFVFVVAFGVFTLVLFIVLVFLMTRINPPPIVDDNITEIVKDSGNKTKLAGRRDDQNDYFYSDDYEEKAFHGLQRAKKTNDTKILTANFSVKTSTSTTVKTKSTTNAHVTSEDRMSPTTQKHGKNRLEVRAVGNYVNNTLGTASSLVGYQRSGETAENNNIERNIYVPVSGTLVLKILDDQGDTRVEIKLNPITTKKNFLYRKQLNRSLLDTENEFYNKIIYDENTDFSNESKIILMANNTIIYNDDGGNKTDNVHFTDREKGNKTALQLNRNNVTDNSILKYLNNVTDKILQATFNNISDKYYEDMAKKSNYTAQILNTTLSSTNNTDMLPLKVVFNNETQLFTNSYKLSASETDSYQEWVDTSRNSTKSGH